MIDKETVRAIITAVKAAREERLAFLNAFQKRLGNNPDLFDVWTSAADLSAVEGPWNAEPRPATRALKELIGSLPGAELRDLEALMGYGRGDGPFASCRKYGERWAANDEMRDYIISKIPLDRYLAAALDNWPTDTRGAAKS
jgi:hypothetical protein